mmetsp:Transcript_12285/g.30840  ORF Transcript_12285/g.30840 Transcript_12285/m.30840 type:complete len:81 (+) Transcript_12285:661-903(+)
MRLLVLVLAAMIAAPPLRGGLRQGAPLVGWAAAAPEKVATPQGNARVLPEGRARGISGGGQAGFGRFGSMHLTKDCRGVV